MPAPQFLSQIIGLNQHKLSNTEKNILEGDLFFRVCDGLKKTFKQSYQHYFCLMKFTIDMESSMLEENFIRHIINDIIKTGEYSLGGIACYTQSSEDVILDIISGINSIPSLTLSRKIIELHRTVCPHLYTDIIKKISQELLTSNNHQISRIK